MMDLLERAWLLEELDGVLATGGRVVLVAGEAGIGKSALVRRFTERRSADARFLLGACDPLLTPRALGPLHDIARQTDGRLAELLASGGPREAVFAAFLDQLAQPSRRQVVVVEDAHWADEATLDLLVFLGRRMERTRALLLVTYRDDELGGDHPLRAVVGRLAPETVRHLRLPPLSEAAVAELARRAGRPAAGLRALTGGNPLLVTEVLAAGDGVPLTVRELVLARFGGLPADAQEVVRLVAVVPTRAELWLVEEAARPAPSAVEVGVSAGLLVVGEEAVGFRHELLRQAVEGSLSALGRRELNRRVLEVLARSTGRQVDVARLVHHAREAGDTEAVLRYAPEAARQAAAVAAHREAVGHYRAVLAHADWGPAPSCWRATRSRPTCRGCPSRRSRPVRPPWPSGRPPATRSSWARRCAGCRGCPGGTATDARRRRPRPGPSPCWSPWSPAASWPWPTATRPSSTCWPTGWRRRCPGPGGRSSWPGGWTTRRRSATP